MKYFIIVNFKKHSSIQYKSKGNKDSFKIIHNSKLSEPISISTAST